MNATQFLRDNHKVLRGLFRQLETADRHPEMKDGIVREITAQFEVHSTIEEELFYPALKAALPEGEQALIDEAVAAHHDAATLLQRLPEFVSSVETHMSDEETRLFEMAEKVLGTQLETLGQKLVARHEQLLASPKYRDARPEVVQNPNGGEQSRKQDKVA